jgi:hypothetical protein
LRWKKGCVLPYARVEEQLAPASSQRLLNKNRIQDRI